MKTTFYVGLILLLSLILGFVLYSNRPVGNENLTGVSTITGVQFFLENTPTNYDFVFYSHMGHMRMEVDIQSFFEACAEQTKLHGSTTASLYEDVHDYKKKFHITCEEI